MSMVAMMEQLKAEKGLGEYKNIATGHEVVKVNWGKTILMNLIGMQGLESWSITVRQWRGLMIFCRGKKSRILK